MEAVGIEPTSSWLKARCIATLPYLQVFGFVFGHFGLYEIGSTDENRTRINGVKIRSPEPLEDSAIFLNWVLHSRDVEYFSTTRADAFDRLCFDPCQDLNLNASGSEPDALPLSYKGACRTSRRYE